MKKIKIIYWITNSLFFILMFGSGIPDLLSLPVAQAGFKQMGYPVYLLPFLGAAKMLGSIVILIPGFPRLKEWAYAGLFIDLAGATYSIAASGDAAGAWVPMLLPIALAVIAYVYYHKKIKTKSSNYNLITATN